MLFEEKLSQGLEAGGSFCGQTWSELSNDFSEVLKDLIKISEFQAQRFGSILKRLWTRPSH